MGIYKKETSPFSSTIPWGFIMGTKDYIFPQISSAPKFRGTE